MVAVQLSRTTSLYFKDSCGGPVRFIVAARYGDLIADLFAMLRHHEYREDNLDVDRPFSAEGG